MPVIPCKMQTTSTTELDVLTSIFEIYIKFPKFWCTETLFTNLSITFDLSHSLFVNKIFWKEIIKDPQKKSKFIFDTETSLFLQTITVKNQRGLEQVTSPFLVAKYVQKPLSLVIHHLANFDALIQKTFWVHSKNYNW